MIVRQNPVPSEPWNLVPLTPEYLEAEHGVYVAAIEAALADDQIRNIALSGNYGVGKSSILREVARRQDSRVVELSLSTLSPIEASKLDDSVPKQATTPTNRIQQEIVKQLLYREEPCKTPGSRFRRIERFRWQREIWTAALLGLAVAVIFLLTGWTVKIASVIPPLKQIGAWTHAIIYGVATGIALLMRWRFYGKLHIKQFSAGSATVTLDDNSVSYFDQYLDEIVYFFEVTDRDVVIFEDIDRFNDSHIFETLRALNTLLNASPQIEKPVRFIYAIKDSIFDFIGLKGEGRKLEPDILSTDDPALAEVVRANRTKFFDLIIPVVPFITHRSARNLAVKLLGKIEHEVASELTDLAAQYVPDMRLLKNVHNEFIVFRDRVFSGDGEHLNLSKTDLFAMMLYKNTHLADFEVIRLGKSKLDTLYKVSREVVVKNIKRLEGERGVLRQRLEQNNGAVLRSEQLGEHLIAHVQRTAEAANYRTQNATYSLEGVARSQDDLKGMQFWTDFVSADGNSILQFRSYNGQTLSFTRDNLAAVLGDPLDTNLWNEADREMFTEQIEEKSRDIKFLRSADLGDLVKRPEFLVVYEGTNQPLEIIAQALLKPGLAYQLVRAGYINRNFTLYTSTFHGDRVSPAATNFIIHHVERDLMDEYFELAPIDVDAVVRERGKNALKEPVLYNIAILDRLLMTDVEAADIMIRSLVALGDSQMRFLQAYLATGERRLQFIERFTVVSSRVLIYIVSQADLDSASRLQLADVVLSCLPSSKPRIQTDLAVSGYLSAHYAEFTTLMSDVTTPDQAERIGVLFADANVTVPRLEVLGRQVRLSFVSRNLYEVTYENLGNAIDNTATLALDIIRTANEAVYGYVLENLSTYMIAISGVSATIDVNEYFPGVIEDVLRQGGSCLSDVVERAAPDCNVMDITKVSEGAWPALAENRRFPATFDNVSHYVATLEVIDAQLAKVLAAAGEITDVSTADEKKKTVLALAILAAKEQLSSVTLRAELVASLNLSEYLSVDDIAAEVGQLFSLLLKHNIIADNLESYEHLAATDWSTRKEFICVSKKFLSYMTPELVQKDLPMLLTSDEINSAVKDMVVEKATEYAEVAGARGLDELARYASLHGHKLPPEVVQKMAQEGVAAQVIVQLLEPHLASIHCDQLFIVLRALDGDYPKLTTVGYDKPRTPNTPADRALLERLKHEGIVGKYDETESPIRVNKKYK